MAKMVKARLKNSKEVSCDCSSGNCGTTNENIIKTSCTLKAKDYLETFMVRWGINRSNYKVTPGLYSIGEPNNTSPVFVTANYKLTFDILRKELKEVDAYILVLDTNGVNVWCAAGKGTFGTNELIKRIKNTNLESVVSHKIVILPQLGAVGVAGHIVTEKTGFKVIYGPVRANDIKEFLKANMKANEAMRTVNFTLRDRTVLIPVELVMALPKLLILFGIFFILNLFNLSIGAKEGTAFIGAVIVGSVLTPILLPFIPFKAFSLKGAILGLIWAIIIIFSFKTSILEIISYLLLIPSISAFLSLNFTGCSTYTSPSGVNKEMRFALPIIIISFEIGALLFITNIFVKGVVS